MKQFNNRLIQHLLFNELKHIHKSMCALLLPWDPEEQPKLNLIFERRRSRSTWERSLPILLIQGQLQIVSLRFGHLQINKKKLQIDCINDLFPFFLLMYSAKEKE